RVAVPPPQGAPRGDSPEPSRRRDAGPGAGLHAAHLPPVQRPAARRHPHHRAAHRRQPAAHPGLLGAWPPHQLPARPLLCPLVRLSLGLPALPPPPRPPPPPPPTPPPPPPP